MVRMIYETFRDYRRHWRPFLTFTVVYMLLSTFAILPLMSYFINRVLLYISSGVLLNASAFRILLDFRGIMALLFLTTLAVTFVLIEMGTLVVMVQRIQAHEEALISEGIMTTLHFIVRTIGVGLLPISVLFLVFLPFLNVPMMPEIVNRIDLPPIFIDTVMSRLLTKGIYYFILSLFGYVLLRSIFVLHEVLLERKRVFSAMKSSFVLTSRTSLSMVFNLLVLNVFVFFLSSAFFTLLARIPEWLGLITDYVIQKQIVRLSSVITLLFTLAILPLNVIFVTKLYNKAKGVLGQPVLKTYNLKGLSRLEAKGIKAFGSKKGAMLALLLLVMVTFVYVSRADKGTLVFAARDVEIISHRGIVDGEFENSLSAIRASLAADIDAVGMDVQLTKDEVIVLSHDRTLERTFGLPVAIYEHTYDELMAFEFEPPWNFNPDDPILPTLDEVLALIKGEMKIHIDVKTFGKSDVFAKKIVDLVNRHEMHEYVFIQSFDYDFLKRVRALDPEIKTCQIMYFALGNLGTLDVDYFTVHSGMLSHDFVRKARKLDKGIWVWTVNTTEGYKEALRYDIDGIITDYPLLLRP